MANANLCLFDYACTYVSGLRNERFIIHTYVAYVQEQNWQQHTERETERERDRQRERQTTIKHRGGTVPFFSNRAVWKKQDHSLQSSVWVKIKNIFLILI